MCNALFDAFFDWNASLFVSTHSLAAAVVHVPNHRHKDTVVQEGNTQGSVLHIHRTHRARMLGFKTVATMTSAGVASFAGLLLVAPGIPARLVLGKGRNTPVFRFMARRYAVLLGGFGALLFSARNAPPTPLRHSISKALAGTILAVMCTGIYEAVWGVASATIWANNALEACIAAMYLGTLTETVESGA